jgi:hypothetical protein
MPTGSNGVGGVLAELGERAGDLFECQSTATGRVLLAVTTSTLAAAAPSSNTAYTS